MTVDHDLLTVKEVAAFLRLSVAETYRLVNSKALNHFLVGPGKGAIRISETDLMTFLEKRRHGDTGSVPTTPQQRRKSMPLKHIQVKK